MKFKIRIILILMLLSFSFFAQASNEKCDIILQGAPPPPARETLRDKIDVGYRKIKYVLSKLLSRDAYNRQNSVDQSQADKAKTNSAHQEYNAHNKNTDNSQNGKGKQEQKIVLRLEKLPGISYFVQTIYQTVNPDTGAMGFLPVRASGAVAKSDAAVYEINFSESSEYSLQSGAAPMLPDGYEFTNSDEIIINQNGNYEFHGSNALMKKAFVIESKPRALNEIEKTVYTSLQAPMHFHLMPKWLQDFLVPLMEKQKAGASDIEIAATLVQFLQKELIYKVDGDSQNNVQQWLYSKKCQCDGAAVMTVSLLRQFFKIPSRPVSGFGGVTDVAAPDASVVVLPTSGHAWIQVYDKRSGLWVKFDPTPKEADREKQKGESNEKYRENPRDGDAGSSNQDQEKSEDKKDSKSDKDQSNDKDQKKQGNDKEQKDSKNGGKSSGSKAKEEMDFITPEEQLAKELSTVQSPKDFSEKMKNFKSIKEQSPEFQKKLEKLKNDLAKFEQDKWADAFESLFQDFSPTDESISELEKFESMKEILKSLGNSSHAKAAYFKSAVLNLERMMPMPSASFKDPLLAVKKILAKISAQPLERQWLELNYPNLSKDKISANKFLTDLENGTLRQFLLRVQVKQYLDLDLLLTPRQKEEYLNWGRPDAYGSGDLVLRDAKDYENPERVYRDGAPVSLDYFRAVSGDLMEALYFTNKQASTSQNEIQYKTSTILLPDMSASNNGNERGWIRDALILRYLDAVAHQANLGQTGSQVVLMPYSDSPENPQVMNSIQQLYSEFVKWGDSDRRNHDGNDTAIALEKALELAASQAGKFSRVNLVLITDGEETIATDDVIAALKKLKGVEVNLVAVTLVTGNKEIDVMIKAFFGGLSNPTQGPRKHHISASAIDKLIDETGSESGRSNFIKAQNLNWSNWHRGKEVKNNLMRYSKDLD